MTPTLRQTLDAPAQNHNGTVVERWAYLIAVNGGLTVQEWGMHTTGPYYGRSGLSQDEALELFQVQGFLWAIKTYEGEEVMQEVLDECVGIANRQNGYEARMAEEGADGG